MPERGSRKWVGLGEAQGRTLRSLEQLGSLIGHSFPQPLLWRGAVIPILRVVLSTALATRRINLCSIMQERIVDTAYGRKEMLYE